MKTEPLHSKEEYLGNPVGLDENVAKEIGQDLDRHLSSMMVLYQQYHKHHWLVEGPQARDLHLFFEEQYNQIHELFDQIAERMTVLGVFPTVHPLKMVEQSYIEHEPEGLYSVRDMLANDLEAERTIATNLRESFKKAIAHGDVGSSYVIQEITFKTEDRAQRVQHFLEEDTLVPEITVSDNKEA